MNRLLYLLALILLASCTTHKTIPTKIVTTQDSTRTEVRYEKIERIDTVYVTLPPQKAERTTPDTTSTLENDYAKSTATILPNGLLYHDLETKPQPIPAPVVNTSERTDSARIEYVEKPVPYDVPVYVEKKLTWWQETQIKGFWLFSIILMFATLWKVRRPLLSLLRKVPP